MIKKGYFFTTDFTSSAGFLEQLKKGETLTGNALDVLVSILQNNDHRQNERLKWSTDTEDPEYDLSGVEVAYNGPNGEMLPTNSKFRKVCVLQTKFPADRDNKLYLQYN